jgi:hypothetical protein
VALVTSRSLCDKRTHGHRRQSTGSGDAKERRFCVVESENLIDGTPPRSAGSCLVSAAQFSAAARLSRVSFQSMRSTRKVLSRKRWRWPPFGDLFSGGCAKTFENVRRSKRESVAENGECLRMRKRDRMRSVFNEGEKSALRVRKKRQGT